MTAFEGLLVFGVAMWAWGALTGAAIMKARTGRRFTQ